MSSTDCIDICDTIVEIMCSHCPNYEKCQNVEDEANHEQMLECLATGTLTNPDDVSDGGTWITEFAPLA